MATIYCLIPDIRGETILAVPAGAGCWTLPSFDQDIEWFAYAATAVARHASEHFGVAMTALHERSIADCKVCELEIQALQWTPPAGTRWIGHGELAALAMEPPALSAVLRAWFLERGTILAVRPPWERRGWYAEVTAWILAACQRLGYTPTGPVEQVKAAWSLSTILRVGTSAGALYFKADRAKPPSEPAIIRTLARRWPHNLPDMVACDHDRGWMLMRDFGEHTLNSEAIDRWQAAIRTFAAIQIACSAELEPWWRLGCPDLRVPALVGHMDCMLADPALLRTGERGGLTEAEAARLHTLTPRLREMWSELAAIPVPSSLVLQDFRHHNLAISGETTIYYDWSDSVVGHPFFACCRFLDFVPGDDACGELSLAERKRRIADAYLEPWTRLLDEKEARRALALTQQLHPLYLAIRWRLDAPYCEPDTDWGRAMRQRPATELRRLLADMDQYPC